MATIKGKRYNRREMIAFAAKVGLGSAVALEQLGGVPLLGTAASRTWHNFGLNQLDAFDMMRDAMQGGPSLLAVAQAMAMDDPQWAVVDIKVVDQVSHPMVFRLGAADGPAAAGVFLASSKMTQAGTTLKAQGLDDVPDDPRMKALRFNKWFSKILTNATADASAVSASTTADQRLGLDATDVCNLADPAIGNKIAFQNFLGLQQNQLTVHQLFGLKARKELGDLGYFVRSSDLIYSPLGITCFMMGGKYDKAAGKIPQNSVLSEVDEETEAVSSRTVSAYVDQIKQFSGSSYADRASIEQNLVFRIDHLVDKEATLRLELVKSRSDIASGLGTLRAAADLEVRHQTPNAALANKQSSNTTTDATAAGASSEFLGQCKYVARAVQLPGMPLRNFSLFLNCVDLDGADLDKTENNGATGLGGDCNAYNTVEGMRQLAMGLNVLAKAMVDGRKLIVYVHSDGGRDRNSGDNTTSWAMVMGPAGVGLMADAVHMNSASVMGTGTSSLAADPGAPAGAAAFDTDGSKVLDASGNPVASNPVPNTGDVAMGVVEFLEGVMGKQVRKNIAKPDNANFIKIKRA